MKPSLTILKRITTYREGEPLCCIQCKESLFEVLKYLDERLDEEGQDPSVEGVDLVAAFGRAAEHFKKESRREDTWQQKVFEAVKCCTEKPLQPTDKDYGERRRRLKNWIFAIIELELNALNQSWTDRVNERIDHYLENCRIAREDGAGSQFGSASGGIMLQGAEDAFRQLRKELLQEL